MASETRLSDTYDRIAQWYDVDMARNMRFDDVSFYADLCQREGGRVLELGCGNGRVLLELVCRNIDAVGIDTSRKMLQQLQHKAKARGLAPSACRMDARKLAFARSFDIVLCPYSLVTYMAQPDDLKRIARWSGQLAGRGACKHPDGATGLLRSALGVFADDYAAHQRGLCVHRAPAVGRPVAMAQAVA